jgi:hypothetical protein
VSQAIGGQAVQKVRHDARPRNWAVAVRSLTGTFAYVWRSIDFR